MAVGMKPCTIRLVLLNHQHGFIGLQRCFPFCLPTVKGAPMLDHTITHRKNIILSPHFRQSESLMAYGLCEFSIMNTVNRTK